jgi:predicted DNA-binding transcriptional regulator AlpA
MIEEKKYSTVQVLELAQISSDTMYRWIRAKKIYVPPVQLVGGVRVRLWTEKEIQAVREYKQKDFGKGRGKRNDLKGNKRVKRVKDKKKY